MPGKEAETQTNAENTTQGQGRGRFGVFSIILFSV
jgi:hypothetical protein